MLIENGVDIDLTQSPEMPERPVGAATALNRVETVRWLLDHGAEINYEWGGFAPTCKPLTSAIINGNVEIAQLLVDAGGFLNVLDRTSRTPLTWAIEYNRKEIADYLRSKGAKEAHEIPGYIPPEQKSPLVQWMENRFCASRRLAYVPLIPDSSINVAVRIQEHENCYCLYTDGMSNQAMNVPPGQESYRYAELTLLLGKWPSDPNELQKPEYVWAINWMRQLAQFPFAHGTWLGAPVTIVANGDPPEPLGPGTDMTCWLLCADKAPFTRAKLSDGKEIVFYTILPIYSDERDYERQHGMKALLERFAVQNVPEYIDPNRPSAV